MHHQFLVCYYYTFRLTWLRLFGFYHWMADHVDLTMRCTRRIAEWIIATLQCRFYVCTFFTSAILVFRTMIAVHIGLYGDYFHFD